MRKVDVIAIDGPSGSGKSTIAKKLAETLGYEYISTGAMYRLIGFLADKNNVFYNDDEVGRLCEEMKKHLTFKKGEIYYKNQNYTEKIYKNRVSMLASDISQRQVVRDILGSMQRDIGLKQKSILEGRDIGTVIFPDAKHKFFLDASNEVRAKRRFDELNKKNENVQYENILKEIIERDKNDSTRVLAPLKKADDAFYIDSSSLSIDEIVKLITDRITNEN